MKFKLKDGREVVLRQITADDYEAVQAYTRQLSAETIFTQQYPGRPEKPKEKVVEAYQNPHSLFLGAFDGDKPVGMVTVRKTRPEHLWAGGNCDFGIHMLAAYQGQGLGCRLMRLMEEWARAQNAHRIEGTVRHTNAKALALYLRCGFEIDGLFKETAFINGEWHHEYHISKILK